MDKNKLIIVLVVVVALVGGAILLKPSDSSTNTASSKTSDESSLDNSDVEDIADDIERDNGASNADAINISMTHYKYSESTIKAKPGDTVVINLSSDDGGHDLVIDELDVSSGILSEGESKEISFTVPDDAAGKTFEYYCSVGNHRAQGMVGQLVIEG